MSRPGETIDAAMLTTSIRVQTRFKANIRAVVSGDDCLRSVTEELRFAARPLFVFRGIHLNNVDIPEVDMKFFESIGRIPRSASSMDRRRWGRRFFDDRDEFLRSLPESFTHASSSHERIGMSRASSRPRLDTLAQLIPGGTIPANAVAEEGWSSG